MITWVLLYHTNAVNVSAAVMATAWGLVPTSVDIENAAGITKSFDMITTAGRGVTREIHYDSGPTTVIPDPGTKLMLEGLYTAEFSAALATDVFADPVTP